MSVDTLVQRAVAMNELERLLRGRLPYDSKSRLSPSPEANDVAEIWSSLRRVAESRPETDIPQRIIELVETLLCDSQGVCVVAALVLLEWVDLSNGRGAFLGRTDEIASGLKTAIEKLRRQLADDKGGGGQCWSDGRLGDLRRLSANTVDCGGPAFFPEGL